MNKDRNTPNPTIKNILTALLLSIFIGVLVAFAYLLFEAVANDGTNWLWNTLIKTDEYRWRVFPLAIFMGIIYTASNLIFKKKQVHKIQIELLDENSLQKIDKKSIFDLFGIFVIGSVSLLAGASLGPEASLLMFSMGIVAWITGRLDLNQSPMAQVLILSAVTALLTSFFFSFIPVLIPLIILFKKKKLTILTVAVNLVGALSAWIVIFMVKGEAFGTVPFSGRLDIENIAIALALGALTVPLGIVVKKLVYVVGDLAEKFDQKFHWIINGIIFGAGIGLLYYLGGESVQFSGNEGVHILNENIATYTALSLFGIFLIKILVTAWSLGTGYRGGLVFPSVFIGVSLAYAISVAFSLTNVYESGATIGAVSGIFVVMINPLIGSVLLFSLFPLQFFPLVIAGILGTFIGGKTLGRLGISWSE